MTKMAQLRIEHNHGVLVLKDVTVVPYENVVDRNGYPHTYKGSVAEGTVVSGSTTNRLFHATHTTHEVPGTPMKYDLYGRKPYQVDAEQDHWYVSVVTCG